MTLGETIKARRLSLNMDQAHTAFRMGITHSAVGNWEKGFSVSTPAHFAELDFSLLIKHRRRTRRGVYLNRGWDHGSDSI